MYRSFAHGDRFSPVLLDVHQTAGADSKRRAVRYKFKMFGIVGRIGSELSSAKILEEMETEGSVAEPAVA